MYRVHENHGRSGMYRGLRIMGDSETPISSEEMETGDKKLSIDIPSPPNSRIQAPSDDPFKGPSIKSVKSRLEETTSGILRGRSSVIENVVGYVVNVHDVLNFDVDLWLNPEQRRRFSTVIANTYQSLDEGNETSQISVAYRCRLRGIGMASKKPYREAPRNFNFQLQKVFQEVKHHINRQNGWVLVNILDVDVYRRLLVDIFDPVSGRNIKDVLMQPTYADFFYLYPSGDSERSRRSRSSTGE